MPNTWSDMSTPETTTAQDPMPLKGRTTCQNMSPFRHSYCSISLLTLEAV